MLSAHRKFNPIKAPEQLIWTATEMPADLILCLCQVTQGGGCSGRYRMP